MLDSKDIIITFAHYHVYMITCIINDNININGGGNADDYKI